MNHIEVLNRTEAERRPGKGDWIVISIRDPEQELPKLQPGWKATLSLCFHDKENLALAKRIGLWRMFSTQDARTCWSFLTTHANDAAGLMVHCTAGLSRSPAIARVAAEHFALSANRDWPQGNSLVLREMTATRPPTQREGARSRILRTSGVHTPSWLLTARSPC